MKQIKLYASIATVMVLVLVIYKCYAINDASLAFENNIQTVLNKYLNTYKEKEYFSGAGLSLYIPGKPIKNFYAGRVSHDAASDNVSANTLFQIGSISKSFTGALILQLENQGKFNIDDSIGNLLPQYNKWSAISIKELLNMTSGLPNYTDTPYWNFKEHENLSRLWSSQELIDLVYQKKFNPPIKSGYFYTNTGYILADMIIEKVTRHTFQSLITDRLIKPADLKNTVYPIPVMDKETQTRLAHGYNYNQYDNPMLVGADVHLNNLSWGAAAGGVVSTSEDIIKWVKALFVDKKILNHGQKVKLTQLISTQTGKPLHKLTKEDPQGFGLGVIAAYREPMGRFWFYEGKTLGFRAIYIYKPCNGVIVSAVLNSATNGENDQIGELIQQVYMLTLAKYPQLHCKVED